MSFIPCSASLRVILAILVREDSSDIWHNCIVALDILRVPTPPHTGVRMNGRLLYEGSCVLEVASASLRLHTQLSAPSPGYL